MRCNSAFCHAVYATDEVRTRRSQPVCVRLCLLSHCIDDYMWCWPAAFAPVGPLHAHVYVTGSLHGQRVFMR